jgi:hypothetical protein
MLIAVIVQPLRDFARFSRHFILKHDPEGYYASYSFRLYNAGDEIAAAHYIAAHTSAQQEVFDWGSDALYYLANRPNSSRFTFIMPLTLPGPYRAAYHAEVMRELMARPPAYIVSGISWDGLSKAEQDLKGFPAMAQFLNEGYSLEKSFGVVDIYIRRGLPHVAIDVGPQTGSKQRQVESVAASDHASRM